MKSIWIGTLCFPLVAPVSLQLNAFNWDFNIKSWNWIKIHVHELQLVNQMNSRDLLCGVYSVNIALVQIQMRRCHLCCTLCLLFILNTARKFALIIATACSSCQNTVFALPFGIKVHSTVINSFILVFVLHTTARNFCIFWEKASIKLRKKFGITLQRQLFVESLHENCWFFFIFERNEVLTSIRNGFFNEIGKNAAETSQKRLCQFSYLTLVCIFELVVFALSFTVFANNS